MPLLRLLRIALLLAAVIAPPLGATEAALSIAEAARLALGAGPGVAAATAQGEAARQAEAEAAAAFKPSLSLVAAVTQYQKPSLVSPLHGFQLGSFPVFDETLFQPALRATFTLYDGGARQARRQQLAALRGAAEAGLGAREEATVAEAAAAFLGVLAAREVLAAEESRHAVLGRERERAGQLVTAGRAAEVELRRAEAAAAAAAADEAAARSRLDEAERQLARLLAREVDDCRAARLRLPVADSLAPGDRRELYERATAASPGLSQARQRLEAARAGLGLARAGKAPNLQAVANELAFSSSRGGLLGEWNAGLQLAWPLYTGGAVAARTARAEAEVAVATADLRQLELAAQQTIDRALAALDEATARFAALDAAVASFSEVARIEKLRLDTETGTQTDYLEAESQLVGARAARAQARFGLLRARVELARALGELSPAWLEAHFGVPGEEAK